MESLPREKVTLHKRIEGIEKQNRRLKSCMILLVLSFLALAVMGAKGASEIIFRKEIAAAESEEEIEALYEDYFEKYVKAYRAGSLRHINDIIEPRETRHVLIRSLDITRGKKQSRPERKHGNIPL